MYALNVTVSCQHCMGTGQTAGLRTCDRCEGRGLLDTTIQIAPAELVKLYEAMTAALAVAQQAPPSPPPAPAAAPPWGPGL